VLDGRTGRVVEGTDLDQVRAAVGDLLADPGRAAAMGAAGRDWVLRRWRWDVLAGELRGLLAGGDDIGAGSDTATERP
ncbi:glycosyltransferase, partial [Frankia sp. AgKG'84/4]|uniref:glycosyltransferase n=1 Tax=Frankia sp. AgKG'84/4 TaxID=573490 RepID=UPI002029BC61